MAPALLERFTKHTAKKNREKQEPYSILVLQTATGDDHLVTEDEVDSILADVGKTLPDFESDIEECKRRIDLFEATEKGRDANQKAGEISEQIKGISEQMDSFCKPLIAEQDRLAEEEKKHRRTNSEGRSAYTKLYGAPLSG